MLVILYVALATLANMTVVWFGPLATLFNAFMLIGVDMTIRNYLQERWQYNAQWVRTPLLILTSGLISYVINPSSGIVAIASLVAFTSSSFTDAIIYNLMIRYKFTIKCNVSNIFGALVDSIVFPTIAFGNFTLWVTAGQFSAKVMGGAFTVLLLKKFITVRPL